MATLRTDITIERPVDEVWAVVSDAGSISTWFPLVKTSTATGQDRHCELEGGVPLDEKIVTNDPQLRRFQYRIVGGGVPVDSHLGTVEVLAISNWLLRRDDQVGCVVFDPVDRLESRRAS